MGAAGTFPQSAAQTDTDSAGPPPPLVRSVAMAPASLLNTLHCSTNVAGSAAQFNQSVSAMPRYAGSATHAPTRGTADTLSKGRGT